MRGLCLWVPIDDRFDVGTRDIDAVFKAQQVLEQDLQRERQPRDVEPGLERVEPEGGAGGGTVVRRKGFVAGCELRQPTSTAAVTMTAQGRAAIVKPGNILHCQYSNHARNCRHVTQIHYCYSAACTLLRIAGFHMEGSLGFTHVINIGGCTPDMQFGTVVG